jgi:hypothetical protein
MRLRKLGVNALGPIDMVVEVESKNILRIIAENAGDS